MIKHQIQTSKSNIELFVYIIVYIIEFEAVLFLRFLVTAGLQHARVCNIVAMFKHRPANQYHRQNHRVQRCHLHLPSVSGYCMTATSTCLYMLVYLPCTYTLTAYRNGHTCKPTLVAGGVPHPVNGEIAIIIYPSTLGWDWHCGTGMWTALPGCCLVVGSKEVHEETISA